MIRKPNPADALIAYLESNPKAAARLRALLTPDPPEPPEEEDWVTLREAGRRLGVCVSWVRERRDLLAPEFVRCKTRGTKGCIYHINYPKAKPQLIDLLTR